MFSWPLRLGVVAAAVALIAGPPFPAGANRRTLYRDETQAVPSPDGQKLLFASRWNDFFPGRTRMVVLDLTPLGDPGDCNER